MCFPARLHTPPSGRRSLTCSRVVRACSCGTAVLRRRIARTQTSSVLEDTSKENWEREPGMVAMCCHSTPAFGGVPNSSNILARPDKSFGVLGDTSSFVKRHSDWNSDLDSIEVERSFPSPDRLSLDNSEEVMLSCQEIEALESTLELSFVFTDLETVTRSPSSFLAFYGLAVLRGPPSSGVTSHGSPTLSSHQIS